MTALESVLDLFAKALERLASDPGYVLTRKGVSIQHPVLAFQGDSGAASSVFRFAHRLLGITKWSKSFSSAQDDPEAAASNDPISLFRFRMFESADEAWGLLVILDHTSLKS